MEKKGQGLSMTTIVVAALALLVLVVLTLIFTGRLNLWNRGMDETMACENYCNAINKQGTIGSEILIEPKCTAPGAPALGVITKKDGKDHYCCCT